jgi:hypothetical protein
LIFGNSICFDGWDMYFHTLKLIIDFRIMFTTTRYTTLVKYSRLILFNLLITLLPSALQAQTRVGSDIDGEAAGD